MPILQSHWGGVTDVANGLLIFRPLKKLKSLMSYGLCDLRQRLSTFVCGADKHEHES